MFYQKLKALCILMTVVIIQHLHAAVPTYLNSNGNTISGFNESNESSIYLISKGKLVDETESKIDAGTLSKPAFVDIDNDGDYDMMVGTSDGTLQYYENSGSKTQYTFVSPVTIQTDEIAYSNAPSFIDLDNDGDFDMLIGDSTGKLFFYTNNGTKTNYSFSSAVKLQVNNSNIDVGSSSTPTFIDLDNDGDYDLVVGTNDGKLNYYENNGTKTNYSFKSAVKLQINGSNIDIGAYSTPSFIDMDEDGDYDMVVGEEDGTLNYFQNIGTKTNYQFTSKVKLQSDVSEINVGDDSAPTFVDLDNDGIKDLVVGRKLGELQYFRNFTNLNYSLRFNINENETTIANIRSYDADDDTLTYGINSNYKDSALFVFNGTSLGFITAPDYENPLDVDFDNTYDVNITITDDIESSWTIITIDIKDVINENIPTRHLLADFNDDQKIDVLIQDTDSSNLEAWITTENESIIQYLRTLTIDEVIIDIADINGDNKHDVIIQNTNNSKIKAWITTEDVSTTQYLKTLGNNEMIIGIADINGDTKDDILIKNINNSRIKAWISREGESKGQYLKTLSKNEEIVHIADINGDGKDDILIKNTDKTLKALISTQNQSTVKYLRTLGNYEEVIDVADISGDSKDDIIIKNTKNSKVKAWISTTSTSTVKYLRTLGNHEQIIEIADINGDNKNDIIIKNNNNIVKAWISQESQSYVQYLRTLGNYEEVIATGYINEDNKEDIIIKNNNNSKIKAWISTNKASSVQYLQTLTNTSKILTNDTINR